MKATKICRFHLFNWRFAVVYEYRGIAVQYGFASSQFTAFEFAIFMFASHFLWLSP